MSSIGFVDQIRVGSQGLTSRRLRAILSALGVAIGIASLVAVLGLSASSRADLVAKLDALGTNLLRVTPGQSLFGDASKLPTSAVPMIGRVGTVTDVGSVSALSGVSVRRTNLIPETQTGGIAVVAADLSLTATLGVDLEHGLWLNEATSRYPTVVLGSTAAKRLGISHLSHPTSVWLGGQWFSVVGILEPSQLATEIDEMAIIGQPIARELFTSDLRASTVYLRADVAQIPATRDVLARTANPQHPEEVNVSRPSDALAAQIEAKKSFTSLFIGLGAVALLVGAVGIANVMVISVLERRREIGVRRALGATRRNVATQFLTEAVLLSSGGGIAGAALGTALTYGYARNRGWIAVVPPSALGLGIAAALLIGTIAGLYPATRAARLSPIDALRTT